MRSEQAAFIDQWLDRKVASDPGRESVEADIERLREELLAAAEGEGYSRAELEAALGQDLNEFLIDAYRARLENRD